MINPWLLITVLGTPEIWLGIAIGLGIFYRWFMNPKRKKSFRPFLKVFAISLLLSFVLVVMVKDTFQVPRPCVGETLCEIGFSFPSGHAAAAFAGFTPLLLHLRKRYLPLFIIPLFVAISRFALGFHTPLDILAGSLIGILIPLAMYKITR